MAVVPFVPTTRRDIEDQHWLADRVTELGHGIEAARDIWSNWSGGRNVGRMHPGMSAGEYIASLGFRLTVAEAMAALPEGSNRQVAAVAGVNEITVRRERAATNVAPDDAPSARVIGADGKSYPGRVVREVKAEILEEEMSIAQAERPSGFRDRVRAESARKRLTVGLAQITGMTEGLSSINLPNALAAAVEGDAETWLRNIDDCCRDLRSLKRAIQEGMR